MCLIEKDKLAAQTGHRCRAWEQTKGVGQAPSTIYNAHTHTLDTSPCQLGAKPFFTLNPKLAYPWWEHAWSCWSRKTAWSGLQHTVWCAVLSHLHIVWTDRRCAVCFFMGLNFILGIIDKKGLQRTPTSQRAKKSQTFGLGLKSELRLREVGWSPWQFSLSTCSWAKPLLSLWKCMNGTKTLHTEFRIECSTRTLTAFDSQ